MRSHTRCCTDGDRMISTKDERQESFAERFLNSLGNVLAGFRNFLKILGALLANGHFFRLFYFEVADVFDRVAELLNGRMQTRPAQSGWPHVHAAAALAEVHGNADDANFLRHHSIRDGNWRLVICTVPTAQAQFTGHQSVVTSHS